MYSEPVSLPEDAEASPPPRHEEEDEQVRNVSFSILLVGVILDSYSKKACSGPVD